MENNSLTDELKKLYEKNISYNLSELTLKIALDRAKWADDTIKDRTTKFERFIVKHSPMLAKRILKRFRVEESEIDTKIYENDKLIGCRLKAITTWKKYNN